MLRRIGGPLVAVVLCCSTVMGCASEKRSESSAVGSAQAVSKPAENSKSAQPEAPRQTEVQGAVAKFEGDALATCAEGTLRYDSTLKPTQLAQKAPLMIAQDALLSARGEGSTALGESDGKDGMATALALYAFEISPEEMSKIPADKQKGIASAREAMAKEFSNPREALKKFDLVLVENCKIPNRTALGRCDIASNGAHGGWSASVYHFDVNSTTDSDKGMKNCLSIGGKWSAAEGRDAAGERMRQHANELKNLGRQTQ